MRRMKQKLFIAVVFVGSGVILAIMSLKDVFYSGINSFSTVLLMLSSVLMVCGVLFKYREELDEIEEVLGIEKRLLERGDREIRDIKRGRGKEISGWRIRDLEYRLNRLEKKAR